MKKKTFAVKRLVYGEVKAVYVVGYTDGAFYYYKECKNLWYAIDKCTGLAVGSSNSRKGAQEEATTTNINRIVKTRATDKYSKYVQEFNALLLELIKDPIYLKDIQ